MNNLGDWIGYNANWAGERVALGLGADQYTYAELAHQIDLRVSLLRDELGLDPGEHIAYLGYNACELIFLLFASARLRASVMPLNNRLAVPEHHWILDHSNTRYLLVEPEFNTVAEALQRELPQLVVFNTDQDYAQLVASAAPSAVNDGNLDDPVLLIYTSGTTGRPKGVVHTQRALFYNALNAIHAQEMRALDHVLSVLPLFHSGGLNIQTTPAFYVGARVSLLRRFDPGETLRAIATLRPTMFLAVPAVIQAMMDHPLWNNTDLSCLRMVGTGSSNVPDKLLNVWHDRGVPATQIYGMTESAPTAICLPIADTQRKLGSAGKPAMHCDARVVDDTGQPLPVAERGEIQLRGPNLFSRYLHEPEMTASSFDGEWFRTGDIGHVDEEGFFYVDDRKKDVIISGGENLYPAEIENVLAAMPEVAEYAVVGRADDRWGEVAVACVVVRTGMTLEREELLKRFDGQLARYKHPRDVVFYDSLPRNAMGKVLKFVLRDQLASV